VSFLSAAFSYSRVDPRTIPWTQGWICPMTAIEKDFLGLSWGLGPQVSSPRLHCLTSEKPSSWFLFLSFLPMVSSKVRLTCLCFVSHSGVIS
jgi:hypothetical protein